MTCVIETRMNAYILQVLKIMEIYHQGSRLKCIYSDINVQVQRYLSRRLPLRPLMSACMGATFNHRHSSFILLLSGGKIIGY